MSFKIIPEGDGFYTIKDVPVFECHDTRGFNCDEVWMREAIQNFNAEKSGGHRPTIIIGHNQKGVEKEAQGFLDNLILKGKRLYADLVRIPADLKEKIKRNAYPGRSVEVLPASKRILALALLGGTTPFFSLPQMVYEQNERSIWYRSPNMPLPNSNGNSTSAQGAGAVDLNSVAQAAAKQVLQQYGLIQDESTQPTVYQLNIQEAAQYLNDNPDAQLFQDGDAIYTQGSEGEYYQIPNQLLQYGFVDKAAGMAKKAGTAVNKAGGFVAGHARNIAGKGKALAGAGAGKLAGAAMRHPKTAAGVALGGAAAVGAAGGYMAGKRSRYSIDENTGVVMFDGQPIGEVSLYAAPGPNDPLPPTDTTDPDLVIEESAVGQDTGEHSDLETPAGDPSSMFVTPVDRQSSDQYQLQTDEDQLLVDGINYALEGNEMQNAELYQLRQEVAQLRQAAQLGTIARKAEKYEAYLKNQKKIGAPVGDIKATVDYMLSLSPEQVAKFQKVLEGSPKVMLGALNQGQQYEIDPKSEKIKSDFQANKKTYALFDVNEKDLQYAQYVRVNRFTNEAELENAIGG